MAGVAALAGERGSAEYLVTNRTTGVTINARYTATPHFDNHGEVAQVFLTVEDVSDLRRAEEAAQSRSRVLEAILANVTVGVLMVNRDGKVVTRNERVLQQHGFTPETAPDNALDYGVNYRVRLPDGRTPTPDEYPLSRALEGETASLELTMEPLNGGPAWIGRYTAAPIAGSGGQVEWAVLTIEDITEPRHAAEALRQSEVVVREQLAEIESIYNNAPVGLCVFDTHLRYQRINRRLAEINGVPPADHIGKTPRDVVPGMAGIAEGTLRRILETGEPVLDVEFKGTTPAHPNEEHVWVEQWMPFVDENGKVLGVYVVVEDVTEQRLAEQRALESQELMRRALEVGRSFAFQFRTRSDEVVRSPESATILGLSDSDPTQDTGPGYFQRVHPEDRAHYVAQVLGLTPENDTYRTTYRIIQPSGSVLHVEESARGLFDEEGTLIQVFGITQDVTERVQADKERERLLAQVQAQRTRGVTCGRTPRRTRHAVDHHGKHPHTTRLPRSRVPIREGEYGLCGRLGVSG